MICFRNYKLRFYPNDSQIKQLETEFKMSLKIWNEALNAGTFDSNHNIELDEAVYAFRDKFPVLTEASKTVLEQKLFDLRKASSEAKKKGAFFPQKKYYLSSARYSIGSNGVIFSAKEKYLELPRLGELNIVWSRVPSIISLITVLKTETGKWFVNILARDNIEKFPKTGKSAYVVVNKEGVFSAEQPEQFDNFNNSLLAFDYFYARKNRLKKRLDRKEKKSKGFFRQKQLIRKCYEKLFNIKNDELHKLTSFMVKEYDNIVIENKLIGKNPMNSTFSSLRKMLVYKCKWHDKRLENIKKSW